MPVCSNERSSDGQPQAIYRPGATHALTKHQSQDVRTTVPGTAFRCRSPIDHAYKAVLPCHDGLGPHPKRFLNYDTDKDVVAPQIAETIDPEAVRQFRKPRDVPLQPAVACR